MRTLIADDDPPVRKLLNVALTRAGYEVIEASSGREAIRKLEDPAICLAVIDWHMEDGDGIEVCRRIKEMDRFVYGIMLTGESSPGSIAIALDAGASDFLAKPVNLQGLLARVRVGVRIVNLQLRLTQAQKLESLGQLAAGISHEINTPLQFVGDNTRFVQEAIPAFEQLYRVYKDLRAAALAGTVTPEFLAEAERAIQPSEIEYQLSELPTAIEQTLEGIDRVTRIVLSMKELSHPGTAQKQAVDLNHLIENAITVSRGQWKYVAELETELNPDLPRVWCLPGEISQVILNLLVNAAHAIADVVDPKSGEQGKITVRTRAVDDGVELTIRDSGTGIPVEIRPRIFDPFFTTKDPGRGTGQGLALAHASIVKKHGGIIRFETEIGAGTEFIIRLPTEKPEEEVSAA